MIRWVRSKSDVARVLNERLTQTLVTIRRYYESEPSYIADPHTAVGLAAAQIVAPEPKYVTWTAVRDPRES